MRCTTCTPGIAGAAAAGRLQGGASRLRAGRQLREAGAAGGQGCLVPYERRHLTRICQLRPLGRGNLQCITPSRSA